ncbi:MAG: serine/threonine protein phosphatase [Bacteroidetes bacterium]|jgi:serine/threonine protein phosphatase 1|nr:serine/threonine protein phosphatase [Bacteroidota bacterium]
MGLIAIGDIHGCAATLDALLDRLDVASDDHLIFVGDYIDRGPNSKAVIDRLLDLRETTRCTFLRGNHEAFMLDYLDMDAFDLWRMNGGLATLQSYANGQRTIHIPDTHVDFVRQTDLYLDTPDFFFVHAGLRPDLTVQENKQQGSEEVFLWERSHLDAPTLAWEKTVVCGHTPRQRPVNRDKLINIDTGCVYHMHPNMGHLTAVRLPEREFTSVEFVG